MKGNSDNGGSTTPIVMNETELKRFDHLALIFTKQYHPSFFSRLISWFTGNGPTHTALWFEAAHIQGMVMEATDKGIIMTSWDDTFNDHTMAVVVGYSGPIPMNVDKASKSACKMLNEPYAFAELTNFITGEKLNTKGFFCSAFAVYVYYEGGVVISFKDQVRTAPADILKYILTHPSEFKIEKLHNVKDIMTFAGFRR